MPNPLQTLSPEERLERAAFEAANRQAEFEARWARMSPELRRSYLRYRESIDIALRTPGENLEAYNRSMERILGRDATRIPLPVLPPRPRTVMNNPVTTLEIPLAEASDEEIVIDPRVVTREEARIARNAASRARYATLSNRARELGITVNELRAGRRIQARTAVLGNPLDRAFPSPYYQYAEPLQFPEGPIRDAVVALQQARRREQALASNPGFRPRAEARVVTGGALAAYAREGLLANVPPSQAGMLRSRLYMIEQNIAGPAETLLPEGVRIPPPIEWQRAYAARATLSRTQETYLAAARVIATNHDIPLGEAMRRVQRMAGVPIEPFPAVPVGPVERVLVSRFGVAVPAARPVGIPQAVIRPDIAPFIDTAPSRLLRSADFFGRHLERALPYASIGLELYSSYTQIRDANRDFSRRLEQVREVANRFGLLGQAIESLPTINTPYGPLRVSPAQHRAYMRGLEPVPERTIPDRADSLNIVLSDEERAKMRYLRDIRLEAEYLVALRGGTEEQALEYLMRRFPFE